MPATAMPQAYFHPQLPLQCKTYSIHMYTAYKERRNPWASSKERERLDTCLPYGTEKPAQSQFNVTI